MKVYALTGNIASGKSTVARYFKSFGIPVIDADRVVHQLYRNGTKLYTTLVEKFGPVILNRNRQINRKKLAGIVFHAPQKRRWLESVTHPLVMQTINQRLKKLAQSQHPFAVVEAALMLESGYYKLFDGLILVHVDPKTQLTRLMNRSQLKSREARQYMKAQWPMKKKLTFANYLIDNSGGFKQTKLTVAQLVKTLKNED